MRIVILGCGYVGTAVAVEGLRRGWSVWVLSRNQATLDELASKGVHTVAGDLADTAWHARMPDQPDLVLNCVSSGRRGLEGYQHSYVDGQQSVVAYCRAAKAGCIIYTSSTSVYTQTGGEWVGEADVQVATLPATAQLLLEAERILLHAGLHARTYVLRLAGIYGPGRHRLLDQVVNGDVQAGSGEAYLNLVHRDDIVSAIYQAFGSNTQGGVFNICDGDPHPKRAIVRWLADRLGLPPPVFDASLQQERGARRSAGSTPPNRRVSNASARAVLGWQPLYTSFREGYASLLETR